MFRFALKNLFSRPVRTLLALCGLTVAIAGMVGLFSVAEGIEASVTSTFNKVPGLAVLQPGAPIPLFSHLPSAWGDEIASLEGVRVVHREIWARANLIEGKPRFNPPRFLFGSDLQQASRLSYSVYREGIQEGRFLTGADCGTSHTIISRPIADQLKKKVGDKLAVDGLELEVVGIYSCKSLLLDVAIIVDIELVRRVSRLGDDSVSNFYLEPEPTADRSELAQRIRDHFRGRINETRQPSLGSGAAESLVLSAMGSAADASGGTATEDSAVEVRDSNDWAKEFRHFSEDLDIFLTLMTAIGVTIAFVGIVNTMLMSVTERFIEFGILKANGWSDGDVLRLIAFESAILGLVGGLAGCLFGWVATHAVNAHWPNRIQLYAGPRLLVASVCFSTVLGILGGLYPALRAARMVPMDAIRRG
jgi:putative ABC transport system permease protein